MLSIYYKPVYNDPTAHYYQRVFGDKLNESESRDPHNRRMQYHSRSQCIEAIERVGEALQIAVEQLPSEEELDNATDEELANVWTNMQKQISDLVSITQLTD